MLGAQKNIMMRHRRCFPSAETKIMTVTFQDLSAARYSGHVEQHETITESRSYSSYTGDRVAPAPPERSVKTSLTSGKFSLINGDHQHDVHAGERRDDRSLSSERGESKWEYMGYGIWENKDSEDGSDSPPAVQRWSAGQPLQTNRVQQGYRDEANTGASCATQELDHLMMSLNNFKMEGGNADEPVVFKSLRH